MSADRKLIHIPVIHTHADMGALGESIKQRLVQELGLDWWERRADVIDRIWDDIDSSLLIPGITFRRVRVYQDALPICGREFDIVRDLAAAGSRNHRLLLELHRRGATIMGTESPELLLEEYRRVHHAMNQPDESAERLRRESVKESILERDRFIADRINLTLAPGEVAFLFLGMLHSITRFLSEDIVVFKLLIPREDRSRIRDLLLEAAG